MIMSHACTPLTRAEGEEFRMMVTHLDTIIRPITRYKLTRTLTTHTFKKAKKYVSSLLDGVRCVLISYDLWMYKTTQDIFSMKAHYTRDHFRDNDHMGMTITT